LPRVNDQRIDSVVGRSDGDLIANGAAAYSRRRMVVSIVRAHVARSGIGCRVVEIKLSDCSCLNLGTAKSKEAGVPDARLHLPTGLPPLR
jgi:hypothetical protein